MSSPVTDMEVASGVEQSFTFGTFSFLDNSVEPTCTLSWHIEMISVLAWSSSLPTPSHTFEMTDQSAPLTIKWNVMPYGTYQLRLVVRYTDHYALDPSDTGLESTFDFQLKVADCYVYNIALDAPWPQTLLT